MWKLLSMLSWEFCNLEVTHQAIILFLKLLCFMYRKGLNLDPSPIQKHIVVVKMLTYGVAINYIDEYHKVSEFTIYNYLKIFVRGFEHALNSLI